MFYYLIHLFSGYENTPLRLIDYATFRAGAALLSGGLQGIMNIPALPQNKVRIRILPDFFRGRTTWQARCIFHFRLGIILLTMLMLLASRLQRKARTAYGTSHW